MEPFERILVRAPNPLGDAVMATPLLRCLRRNWPRARITVVATPAGAGVYEGLETVDRIEVFLRGEDRGLAGIWRSARRLRGERFDLAVVCPNSHSSALHAWIAGARRRVGWSYNGRGLLLTDPLGPEMQRWGKRVPVPMVEYYLDLARRLGAEATSPATELRVTPAGEAEALAVLEAGGWKPGTPLAGLGVGSSFGPSKLWTAAAFAAVGNALTERGLRVALLYGPGEEEVAAAVAAGLERPPVVGPAKALGLGGLKSVCSRMSVLVSTDTGPRHVAVAFGVPVVVVMGPTDPEYTNCNLERTTVLRESVDCAPWRWPCHEKDCPLAGERRHQCMERIPPERAVRAATELMAKFPR
jgi:heptosyltransferase-2